MNLPQEHPDGRTAGALAGRAWLAALPDELAAQRRVMAGLADRCEAWPLAMSLLVGCSLGRGAADALSDIDAALGVDAALDLAVVAEAEIETRLRAGGAPDFVPLYQAPVPPGCREPGVQMRPGGSASVSGPPAAYAVTGEQVREWAFHGWCALIDADKYLRRGSLWEAHSRLHEARHYIWALWAAAHGALYPWHGLSQVLDHDPGNLPPDIESTVAGLDPPGLRRAARASAKVLTTASEAAARRHPADLPAAMAAYVTRMLSREP